jgi:CRISPR-associated protein Csb3
MQVFRVKLNPANPGMVLACTGLAHLVNWITPEQEPSCRFVLTPDVPDPAYFELRTRTLVVSEWLPGVLGTTDGRGSLTLRASVPENRVGFLKERNAPVTLTHSSTESVLVLDWWLDEFRSGSNLLETWSGMQRIGTLLQELLDLCRDLKTSDVTEAMLYQYRRASRARLCFDPRVMGLPLQVGFSLDANASTLLLYPLVEFLSAVGLQRCRLQQEVGSRYDQPFWYHLWSIWIPASLLGAAYAGALTSMMPTAAYTCDRIRRVKDRGYFSFDQATKQESEARS